jgi:hypothetical protein
MSENPVFDTVQALYPDVHIPDRLEVLKGWGGKTYKHVVVPRNMTDLVADAQELMRKPLPTSQTVKNDFPAHTVRSPITSDDENRRLLRSPKHGR